MIRPRLFITLALLLPLTTLAQDKKGPPKSDAKEWKILFDGKSLTNWKTAEFGGQGDPIIKDSNLIIPMGETLSGVAWAGDPKAIPTINYEVSLEAQRVTGSDFFVGLTFPYQKSFASLILGGWGGAVCGISSVDGEDAAHNSTATVREFKDKQWYRIHLRVTDKKIEAWVNDDQVVDLETEDHKIDTRADIDLCKPFGLGTYQTTAAIRDIKIRSIPEKELPKK
jgi:hypothetical protein